MSTFDPTRILNLARVLNSGSSEEKLSLIEQLDPHEAIDSGVLMRALQDGDARIRLASLQRLAQGDVRPMNLILDDLLEDDDETIRRLADELKDRPETVNPLEQLVPMIEKMADSLGPLGGLLRSMIDSMRGIADDDEREQLRTVGRLDSANPASLIVVQQALRSAFISVRLAALRKVLALDHARVPESLITQFVTDPSADVREAAEAVVRAHKVGTVDENVLRDSIMGSMMGSLGSGLGGLDLGALMQGGGLDLGSILGGAGGLDLSSILGGGNGPPQPEPSRAAGGAQPHEVNGWVYIVGDARVRERLLRSLGRLSIEDEQPAEWAQLDHPASPARWAIEPVTHEVAHAPGWVETLAGVGLELEETLVAEAEQARFVSEQIWGATFADHSGPVALTLVFHDGVLSRAEWSGERRGAYAGHLEAIDPTPEGPLALLGAFLDDPTDDKLIDLAQARTLFES